MGGGRPKTRAASREGDRALLQPVLQHVQPADVREGLVARIVFQQAAFPDDLLLLREDLIHVLRAQPRVLHDDLREDVLRFAAGQPQRRLQQSRAACLVQVDLHLIEMAARPP